MLFQTFLKRYSKKGSVNFHGLPKGSVAWKRLTAPGKPYNARRDKVSGGWYHLSDQRPGHTKVPENAGLLDSLPPSTSRGISQGTQLPLVPFNSFQRKGAVEINVRRRQGVQPHRSERLQGGRTASEPDASFHTSAHQLPASHAAQRAAALGSHGNHLTPDRATGQAKPPQPEPAYNPLSLPAPPFSVLSTGWGTRGPCGGGTELKFPPGGAGRAGARTAA